MIIKKITAVAVLALGLSCFAGCEGEKPKRPYDPNDPNDPSGRLPADEYYDSCTPILTAVVRDFSDAHPDFHHSGEDGKAGADLVTGMVRVDLGEDDKPRAGDNDFYSDHLDEWYVTDSAVNKEFTTTIELSDVGDGVWSYNNDAFFPLGPDQGFGHENLTDNSGTPQNFLFTTELRLIFMYKEGQRFKFKGDDDLWVFINRKLAIDLGGIHSEQELEVDIDAHAAKYGMTPNQQYTMHIFHAERNPTESHFRIDTDIECFAPQPVV